MSDDVLVFVCEQCRRMKAVADDTIKVPKCCDKPMKQSSPDACRQRKHEPIG